MTSDRMENVEAKLGRLLKHIWACRTTAREMQVMGWGTGSGHIGLTSEGAKAFGKALVLLFDVKEIADRVSHKVIGDCIREEVTTLSGGSRHTIETDTVKSARRLLSKLVSYPVESSTVNVPVFGLELWPYWLEFQVGDVLIYCIASTPHETESGRWFNYVDPEELRKEFDFESEGVEPSWGSNYWAKTTILANDGDSDRLHSEVTRRVRESLALLALFVFAYPKDDYRRTMYLDLEPILSMNEVKYDDRWRHVVETSVNGQYQACPLCSWERRVDPYLISHDVLESFKKEGFDACCDVLRRNTPRPITIRIGRALEYFYYGMEMPNVYMRYLSYVSGLEALLLAENERRFNESILSKRVSCLLETDAAKRKQLRSHTKWLYDIRCNIVHGASPAPVEVWEGLRSARWVLYSLIRRLATGKENFSSVEEVVKWVNTEYRGS
jgi:hypothetical protein